MNSLRLILLLAGLLILAGIVVHYHYKHQPRRPALRGERREPRILPVEDEAEKDPSAAPREERRGAAQPVARRGLPFFDGGETGRPASDAAPALGGLEADERAEKIVVLYLKARDDRRISGVELLDAALKAGLEFGERRIFHRLEEGSVEPVYSMANLTAPGDFDPAEWSRFATPGVALFMVLPGTRPALDRWEAMHAAAERLAQLLDADLLDDARCRVTRQRLAQLREQMREHDRRHGASPGAQ